MLVVTGAAVLAAVSTVVAFKGWPGSTAERSATPSAMLVAASLPDAPASVPDGAVVIPDAPARPRVAEGHPAAIGQDTKPAPVTTPGADTKTVVKGVSDSGPHEKPSPAAKAPAVPTPAEPVREAGTQLGTAVDETVQQVGNAVDPVSPQLGQAVDDTGRVVNDTVQGVTNTLADVLDNIIKP